VQKRGKMTRRAGIGRWRAHEGRHTAVSIMSSNGVPIQEISDTVGHKSTHFTETVYRHVIVPAIRGGTAVMDGAFDDDEDDTDEGSGCGIFRSGEGSAMALRIMDDTMTTWEDGWNRHPPLRGGRTARRKRPLR
jgi:integrase-like protein